FGAAKHFPQNSCYCLRKDVNDCDKDGLLELSHCLRQTGGAPVALSWPYFMDADRRLRDDNMRLRGALPLTFDNYGTFLDIEPTTGAPLNAVKRMQLNVRIGHSEAIKWVSLEVLEVLLLSLLSPQTTERHAQGKGLLGARALGRTGKPLFQTAFPLNTCFGRQSGALDDKFAEMFKSQLINTKRAVTAVSVGLIVVGVLALVIAVYLVFKNMNQNQ
ncbi:unnamed protein product, partial [Oppiella nova]